jgi:hypothetical protein
MNFERDPEQVRAYPYRTGWHGVGCAVVLYGLIGAIVVSLFPAGYDRFESGQLPTGIALMMIGVLGVPTIGRALWFLIVGLRHAIRPPLVRVEATALLLPPGARGDPPLDEDGEQLSPEPPQPVAIPLAAIRRARRSGPRFNAILELTHDLSPVPLLLHQNMMRAADFEDLVRTLQRAVPAAFAAHGIR